MKQQKKKKKPRTPRKDFAQRLAEKLSHLGTIDAGRLTDESCRWVDLEVKGVHLSFQFDLKGEKITEIGIYQDVVEVTGQKRIWKTNDERNQK